MYIAISYCIKIVQKRATISKKKWLPCFLSLVSPHNKVRIGANIRPAVALKNALIGVTLIAGHTRNTLILSIVQRARFTNPKNRFFAFGFAFFGQSKQVIEGVGLR
jgi:hypothetical protein